MAHRQGKVRPGCCDRSTALWPGFRLVEILLCPAVVAARPGAEREFDSIPLPPSEPATGAGLRVPGRSVTALEVHFVANIFIRRAHAFFGNPEANRRRFSGQ